MAGTCLNSLFGIDVRQRSLRVSLKHETFNAWAVIVTRVSVYAVTHQVIVVQPSFNRIYRY